MLLRKELPSVPKLSSFPSITHHWEELLTIFHSLLIQRMTSARIIATIAKLKVIFSLGSNHVKKLHNAPMDG